MKAIALALILVGTQNAHAFVDQCANDLETRITYAYNDGGLTLTKIVGPVYHNEGTEQGGLVSKVSYAVSYKNDPQVNPGPTLGQDLVTAECSHDEPSAAVDKNGDGIFTLLDAVTLENK